MGPWPAQVCRGDFAFASHAVSNHDLEAHLLSKAQHACYVSLLVTQSAMRGAAHDSVGAVDTALTSLCVRSVR